MGDLREQLREGLISVKALRVALGRASPAADEDLAGLEELLERLRSEHGSYLSMMDGLKDARSARTMASLWLGFLTYIRQDFEAHASPDAETTREFHRVLDALYGEAKQIKRYG
jgi:hypothetical protein